MIISVEGLVAGGAPQSDCSGRLAQKVVPYCVRWHARLHSAFDMCVPASQYAMHWASVSLEPPSNGTVAGAGMLTPVGTAHSTGLACAYPDKPMMGVMATAMVATS